MIGDQEMEYKSDASPPDRAQQEMYQRDKANIIKWFAKVGGLLNRSGLTELYFLSIKSLGIICKNNGTLHCHN